METGRVGGGVRGGDWWAVGWWCFLGLEGRWRREVGGGETVLGEKEWARGERATGEEVEKEEVGEERETCGRSGMKADELLRRRVLW